jgi:hypothetical protein
VQLVVRREWAFVWFLCPLLEGNLVIVDKGIVVGAFVVIAVNTMIMAICCLQWWGGN